MGVTRFPQDRMLKENVCGAELVCIREAKGGKRRWREGERVEKKNDPTCKGVMSIWLAIKRAKSEADRDLHVRLARRIQPNTEAALRRWCSGRPVATQRRERKEA